MPAHMPRASLLNGSDHGSRVGGASIAPEKSNPKGQVATPRFVAAGDVSKPFWCERGAFLNFLGELSSWMFTISNVTTERVGDSGYHGSNKIRMRLARRCMSCHR